MFRFDVNDKNIRMQPRITVMVLPMALVFLSLIPTAHFTFWLASSLGMDINAPFQEQPNHWTWFVLSMGALALFVVTAALLGWFLNGIVLRVIFKWPTEKVIRLLIHSETPPEWLLENSSTDSPPREDDER